MAQPPWTPAQDVTTETVLLGHRWKTALQTDAPGVIRSVEVDHLDSINFAGGAHHRLLPHLQLPPPQSLPQPRKEDEKKMSSDIQKGRPGRTLRGV
jgi:hypothetical protein